MAKQSAGFVHEHIEKVVIAVCAAFLIFAIYVGFAAGRFNVTGPTGEAVSPSDLIKTVGDAADRAASAVLTAKPKGTDGDATGIKDGESVDKLLAWYGANAKTLGENAGVSMEVARAQAFPPLFVTTTSVSDADKHNIARLVDPDLPVVATGTSTLELPIERPTLENFSGTSTTKTKNTTLNWVAVAAQVNLQEQDLYFKTEKYPPFSYLDIVKVHLQRLDRDEKWRGWQDVETWLPFEPFDRLTASQSRQLRDLIDPNQEVIARPRLADRVDGDRIEYDKILPFLDAPPKNGGNLDRLAKDWIDRANRAGKSSDFETAMIFARSAMQAPNVPAKVKDEAKNIYERALARVKKRPGGFTPPSRLAPADKMMPIVAYDLTAVPGHEYQYRIRYEAWNQFAGRDSELKDPSSASVPTIFSGFSPVTPPVLIESDVQFYLTDARKQGNKAEAKVTVWKRSRRKWEKQEFRLAVGEAIGKKDKGGTDFSTGAVIVDIRFNETVNGKQETILVYVGPDGRLREAVLSVDKKLNEEQKNRA